MARTRIHAEDIAGASLAALAHVALIAWLVWMPRPTLVPPPERVMVTLSGEVGEQASAPSREAAAPAVAPVLSKEPLPEPAPAIAPNPLPLPVPKVTPPPVARVVQPPVPKPMLRPAPAPASAPAVKREVPKPQPRPVPAPRPMSRVGGDFLSGESVSNPQTAQRSGGASKLGDDFLKGVSASATRGKSPAPAGPAISAQVRSSLVSEVSRQIKPKWQAPSGVDVDLLATTIEWDLNPDGTLVGPPRFVSQSGVNGANSAQAARHREQAIRAIRLASPFTLPLKFYAGWQHLRFTFDRKLSQ